MMEAKQRKHSYLKGRLSGDNFEWKIEWGEKLMNESLSGKEIPSYQNDIKTIFAKTTTNLQFDLDSERLYRSFRSEYEYCVTVLLSPKNQKNQSFT